jgi:uncharacterized protein YfcZ (UPF0381/DUF406 family)
MQNNPTSNIKRGFKPKTIEQTIRKKMSAWIKTIEDESLRKEVVEGYIVTGGAITSMLLGDLPNDYDVYFRTPELAAKVATYYVGKLPKSENEKAPHPQVILKDGRVTIMVKSAGITGVGNAEQEEYDYFEFYPDTSKAQQYLDAFKSKGKGEYAPVVVTTNAISLTDDVQLVLRFTGDPAEIHKNYDFVHTTNWYTYKDGLNVNQSALLSILSRELKYVGSLYPICSMFRLKKFIKRGWTITAGEMLKIAYDISKLDLHNVQVLQEQLTGVDAAYFNQLISLIKKEGKEIDRTYLVELINRVFDEDDDAEELFDADSN